MSRNIIFMQHPKDWIMWTTPFVSPDLANEMSDWTRIDPRLTGHQSTTIFILASVVRFTLGADLARFRFHCNSDYTSAHKTMT